MNGLPPEGLPERGPGHFDRFTFKNETANPVNISFTFTAPFDPAVVIHGPIIAAVNPGMEVSETLPPNVCAVDVQGDVDSGAVQVVYNSCTLHSGLTEPTAIKYYIRSGNAKAGELVEDITHLL